MNLKQAFSKFVAIVKRGPRRDNEILLAILTILLPPLPIYIVKGWKCWGLYLAIFEMGQNIYDITFENSLTFVEITVPTLMSAYVLVVDSKQLPEMYGRYMLEGVLLVLLELIDPVVPVAMACGFSTELAIVVSVMLFDNNSLGDSGYAIYALAETSPSLVSRDLVPVVQDVGLILLAYSYPLLAIIITAPYRASLRAIVAIVIVGFLGGYSSSIFGWYILLGRGGKSILNNAYKATLELLLAVLCVALPLSDLHYGNLYVNTFLATIGSLVLLRAAFMTVKDYKTLKPEKFIFMSHESWFKRTAIIAEDP